MIDGDNADRDERRALDRIRAALAALAEQAAVAHVDEALDWQCVRDFLDENLGEPERGYRFFSGGISVCGMVPLRAVPFRVICLIGMNEETFPRRDRVSMLNRMHDSGNAAARRVPGGRSDRDEDRYLFLQLLSAARDVFYLSWVGEDQRDGGQREPSAVVAELLDLAAGKYFDNEKAAREHLRVKHPMQPFSPGNFSTQDPRLFSYRREWRNSGGAEPHTSTPAASKNAGILGVTETLVRESIDLDDLRRFLRAPARHYLHGRLGLRLDAIEDGAEDEDSLCLNGLEKYTLRSTLVGNCLADDAADVNIASLRAQGLLPVGRAAGHVLEDEREVANALVAAVRNFGIDVDAEAKPFALQCDDGSRLAGNLPLHRDRLALRWSVGKLDGKRLLDAWIEYLAFVASAAGETFVALGLDRGEVQQRQFAEVTAIAAKATLATLLEYRRKGLQSPLLFFPKTSFTYAQRWQRNENLPDDERHAAALAEAQKVFDGGDYSAGESMRESAFALVARDRGMFEPGSPTAREFAQLALEICEPLLDALTEQSA